MTQAQISEINMETDINASPDKVWKALTENIGDWWPNEFYAGGEAGKRNYIMEATPGGRMGETWDTGGGVLWGTVVTVEPSVRLQVLGVLFPNWGGPAQCYGTWELTATDGGTRLSYSESALGHVTEEGTAEKTQGWKFLWQVMKAYIEGKPAPEWASE